MTGMPKTKRDKLRAAASVTSLSDFKFQLRSFDRPSIVAEGDSWFEYPRNWKLKAGNIVDHISKWTKGKANLLRLGANGDEATAILSTPQRHRLTKLLDQTSKSGRPVDILLFSAGGNDVVGKWDLERFVLEYQAQVPIEKLFHTSRLQQKVKQIELAYRELMAIRNRYSRDTVIVTHTYDRVIPSDIGVRILGKNVTGPWIKPTLDKAGFPTGPKQRQAAKYLLETLQTMQLGLQNSPEARGRFFAVKTHGLVHNDEWRNEIHPTTKGFKKVAAKVYDRMRAEVPNLPPRPNR